jgi:hypothetical protein
MLCANCQVGDEAGFPFSRVWLSHLPLSISFFVWLAMLGKILMMNALQRKGVQLVNRFSLCKNDGESVNCLLLLCPFSWKVRSHFFAGIWLSRGRSRICKKLSLRLVDYSFSFSWEFHVKGCYYVLLLGDMVSK